jgi:hypothetical protein
VSLRVGRRIGGDRHDPTLLSLQDHDPTLLSESACCRRTHHRNRACFRASRRRDVVVCILLATVALHEERHMELDIVVDRVREEFREMPGLRLTPAQATRLWGLERETAAAVIERLVACSFLRRTESGLVTRAES